MLLREVFDTRQLRVRPLFVDRDALSRLIKDAVSRHFRSDTPTETGRR